MTHDETLRAAAARLRDLATAAAVDRHDRPTPQWHAAPYWDDRPDGPWLLDSDTGPSVLLGGNRTQRPHLSAQHATYIAAMDPTLGLALADWLDAYGLDWDRCPADHPGTDLDEHALAVARQILRTETDTTEGAS